MPFKLFLSPSFGLFSCFLLGVSLACPIGNIRVCHKPKSPSKNSKGSAQADYIRGFPWLLHHSPCGFGALGAAGRGIQWVGSGHALPLTGSQASRFIEYHATAMFSKNPDL